MMNTKQKLTDYDLLKKDYMKATAINTELLEVLEQAMVDINRTGYTKVPTIRKIEEAIRKASR